MSLSPGDLQQLLGSHFVVRRELGGGSMAAVYQADDTRHGRQVAIKLLRPEYAATIAAERFLREIEIAARLQHPHIVPLLDSGAVRDTLYLVMPYIEGESLRVRLVREGRLAPAEVIRILTDVADALAYAHRKGIVHRDIKPDNILLSGRHALVTDFGVAKAVAASGPGGSGTLTVGVALGTPAYMAPEQATAAPDLDQRVDIYALGVVAYELLTGTTPFTGSSAQALLTAHVLEAPVPVADRRPDIPPALGLLIDKCLAKRAEDRWQSAEELLRHLEPLATPSGGSTPASVAPVAPRRARWAVPAIAAGAALAAAAFFLVRPRPVLIGMAGSQRQITFTGQVTGAAISPDGELLAFVADSGGGNRLMLQDLRGGRAILLARSARFDYPTWSADGSEIRCFTFDSARPVLLRIPRLGGPERGLAAPFWSALSPSGDQLAELRQGGSALVLRMMATGDSVSTPVEPGFWHSLPTWSRDGEWLAWSEAPQSGVALNRLVVFSARRRVATVVRQDSVALGAPGWDGDGRAIYFLRGQDRVVNLMRLPLDRQGKAAAPAELIRAGITAGLPQTYVAFQPPPSVSADGRLLVYAQRQEWANLAIAEVEEWRRERRYHPLTTGSASWEGTRLSPDQRSVAAERTETDGMSLQVIPLDGGGPREVGRLLGPGGLAWSPRGDQIVVAALDPDSGRGLGFFPVSGGPARRTARGAVGDTPEWIADTLIIVPRTGNRAMQYVNVGTGRVSPVPGLDTTGWMFYPRRSPEGRRVAFAWNEGGGRMTVNVLDAGGRLLPVATGLLNPLGWSQDGRTIYVGTSGYLADSSRVLAVAADGSGQRALATFPPNLEPADVTRDGRRVVLVVHEQRADAWSIQFPARR